MSYGPAFTVKRTEKEWPSQFTKSQYEIKLWLDDCRTERRFDKWLTMCKFYGAEIQQYEDEFKDFSECIRKFRDECPLSDLEGILAPYITEYEDPVEAVKKVRDMDLLDV